jgi:hypothetical protein
MDVAFDLEAVWKRLANVNTLVFKATSGTNNGGWNGEGRGSVVVEGGDSKSMLFHEEGMWKPATGKELTFTNVYRWTALLESRTLQLEHLRFGHDHSVYLFDLEQTDEVMWLSIEPHVCRDELYTAIMKVCGDVLTLHWTIEGPTKNASIHYSYQ